MRLLSLYIMLFYVSMAVGQTEFSHMHYNLTLYGNPFGCEDWQNDPDNKDEYLKDIVAYSGVSILCVNELGDEDQLADRILDNALNVDGVTQWSRAELTDFATPSSILNAFYYRSDVFTMVDQSYINQSVDGQWLLRPIDLYSGYLNTSGTDTTFITFVVCHLAASDSDERAAQTEALMAEIETRGIDNYILSGDFNIDSSTEESFQNLIATDDPTLSFHDPVNALGNWSSNSFYSDYHTQSTRFSDTNSGCFSGGGLDDRFDMTLISETVLIGDQGLIYMPDSYRALGQGGDNYNSELITISNSVVPDSIALALYEMSDHLPVVSSFQEVMPIGLSETNWDRIRYENPVSQQLTFFTSLEENVVVKLTDLTGKLVGTWPVILRHGLTIDVAHIDQGMYILSAENSAGLLTLGRLMVE